MTTGGWSMTRVRVHSILRDGGQCLERWSSRVYGMVRRREREWSRVCRQVVVQFGWKGRGLGGDSGIMESQRLERETNGSRGFQGGRGRSHRLELGNYHWLRPHLKTTGNTI